MAALPRPLYAFKLMLLGDGGVGKTTYTRRNSTGEFVANYVPTMGVEVRPIRLETSVGPVVLNCWDTAGQEKLGGLRDGYYIGAHAAIIMFDLTSRTTEKSVGKWFQDFRRVCPAEPVVVVGSKADCKERKVKTKDVTWPAKNGLEYIEVSAKSNYNFELPFLTLLRKLTGVADLRIV